MRTYKIQTIEYVFFVTAGNNSDARKIAKRNLNKGNKIISCKLKDNTK